MEFIANKIDPEIRNKIQEGIKTGKIHSGKSINVNEDLKDHGKGYYTKLKTNESEQKEYITIDGVKNTQINLSVKAEKLENINQENSRGGFLDTKK